MSFIQEAGSGPSREISGTCGKSTLSMSSHSTGHAELSLGSSPWEILLRAGSENEPIQLHSTPVLTRRWNTNQERLDPPKLLGERRFIDNVLEKEDRVTEVIPLDEPHASSMVSFIYNSPSDFLTPLVEVPTRINLVAETTLSWSSQKSTPSGRASQVPIQTIVFLGG